MNELVRPLVRLWDWVERVGGFPGQLLFLFTAIMLLIGGLTWFSNKR